MRTEAYVIKVEGQRATVEVERTSACEGCHKSEDGKGCSVCSMLGGERRLAADAVNKVGAEVGDRVVIESPTGRMLWYAALVFLLPLVVALLAYGVAALLTESMAWQIGGALIGFLGTFLIIFAYSEIVRKKRLDIEITEIVKKHSNE